VRRSLASLEGDGVPPVVGSIGSEPIPVRTSASSAGMRTSVYACSVEPMHRTTPADAGVVSGIHVAATDY
jgi:hypothetical protein